MPKMKSVLDMTPEEFDALQRRFGVEPLEKNVTSRAKTQKGKSYQKTKRDLIKEELYRSKEDSEYINRKRGIPPLKRNFTPKERNPKLT